MGEMNENPFLPFSHRRRKEEGGIHVFVNEALRLNEKKKKRKRMREKS
jgi:hypothetical protein